MKFKTACLAASLAAAGLATAGIANAQGSVTLYGILDVNVEVHNNAPDGNGGSKTATGMRSGGRNGNRWGLRGTEDLGNGLKAVFQLESGFNISNGRPSDSTRLFNRTAMVGLAGGWGELAFGRQYTSGFLMMSPYLPNAAGAQYEPLARLFAFRADNSIKYTGKFGGLNVGAYYAFREFSEQQTFDAGVTGAWGAAATYQFGNGLRLGAGYDRVEEPANPAVITGENHNAYLAARWDVDKLRVQGIYRWRSVENGGVGGADLDSNMYMLGLGYQASPALMLQLAYYMEDFDDAPAGYLGTTDDKWHQLAFLASYNLSKRTSLYATLAHARKGPINLGYSNDGGTSYALAPGKSSQTGGAIGIRHLF